MVKGSDMIMFIALAKIVFIFAVTEIISTAFTHTLNEGTDYAWCVTLVLLFLVFSSGMIIGAAL